MALAHEMDVVENIATEGNRDGRRTVFAYWIWGEVYNRRLSRPAGKAGQTQRRPTTQGSLCR